VRRGQTAAALDRRTSEVSVPRDKYYVGVEDKRTGEMYGVIAAERVVFGELPRLLGERPVDPDRQQLAPQRLELVACRCVCIGLSRRVTTTRRRMSRSAALPTPVARSRQAEPASPP
jgi:hypothetical protein